MAELTKKDFASPAEVKWCPGCGDYAIMNAVRAGMVAAGKPRDEVAIVSGIGCSSRFPYYMETYGLHTIHGRAAAIASGVKVGNPKLDVWVISGDGDSTAIGGNHFMHAIRRNINLNYVMINNKIYGLTKGQYSPTSEMGQISKTTPYGVIDYPMTPLKVAMGLGATFVARGLDAQMKLSEEICKRGAMHKGFSMMEIFANCIIYNDGAHQQLTDKETGADYYIILKDGEKMIFGTESQYCLVQDGFKIKAAKVADVAESDILVHDEKNAEVAALLATMRPDANLPLALGIIFADDSKKTYDDMVYEQVAGVKAKRGRTVDQVMQEGHTWTV
ncbi:2-oxoacid:ferredoxin oxidoreductase subunit beta [Desulfuromonas acetoxidans]|uniref:Thiamine pyrophosphate enzyme-like TPP-binding n=1 Tax=Desulfuromonas acetoxidans (strain DSM 684 / 11070) TaxID=281689 RepID=Q1JVN2_DESA6|nr:2-oxoacid:ferredoxin oxidoreductase subunit beta [Desulfuromonas acetoxidans]EAT14289.1 thiamine pyrophosphate enzyme-like TPP-binding [Desulfuromonas acetoxidans DSM 684]MBF0647129.1 2-oxoacid:ferredoxin oxidoreductase subunit beta [Desulfuromonas acetoxidans]NVD25056.1 2-oxoacid:ferredoxin oxidoreductase subunit beta [Desulfuromonas acetoxidans]NVE17101.1 2-oxoacid:ferredoxin oxidoreductase subunit beta [Desulfuromonas acetoxidans]